MGYAGSAATPNAKEAANACRRPASTKFAPPRWGGGSRSRPRQPKPERSRRRREVWPPAGEHDAREAPLAIPDAISQLEALNRTLLTRPGVERLLGVSGSRRRR